MEKWKKRTVELLTYLAFGGEGDPQVVPYYPQKTRVGDMETRFFRRSTPERHGISSARLYNMLSELEAERRANIHSLMVFHRGEVISECSSPGYDVLRWHVSHSMAKTVTGMIVGILVGEGLINTEMRLVDIFPEITYRDKKFPEITVGHLLSMTSGVEFAEAGVVTETKWIESYFSSVVRFAPGSKFAYNSMNSYILARVCERVSGVPFGSLAEGKFFSPLGIRSYLWENGPEGVEKGGWGLYMSPESWARVGLMLMGGGVFMGTRVLPEDWVRESTVARANVPDVNGGFNYGYHIWVARDTDELLFNGMLGQNLWICPKNDIMVVMTGGNNEMFQASPALEIVRAYLGGRIEDIVHRGDLELLRQKERSFFYSRLWVRPTRIGRGIFSRLGLGGGFDFKWYGIMGSYAISQNRAGMLPLVMRAMQNNFSGGIEEISIGKSGSGLWLSYVENGVSYRIAVGLSGYEKNLVDLRGEKYLVLAMGEAGWTRHGQKEYKIELLLPETASVRRLRLSRIKGDVISIHMSEVPNDKLIQTVVESYSTANAKLGKGIEILDKRVGRGSISEGVHRTFSPRLVGVDKTRLNFQELLDEENKKTAEMYRRSMPMKGIIEKLFFERKKTDK